MPTGAKTVVTQIVLLIMYFGVFVPTFLYPNFQNFLGSFAFLPFSFISFGFFVYFYFNLVETKQKEVYENVNQMEFETPKNDHNAKPTKYLWLLVFLYGLSAFDYQLTLMFNFLSVPLKKFFNESIEAHYDVCLDDTSYSILLSILANIPTLASVISIFFLVPKIDVIGRKGTALHLKSCLGLLASLAFIFSKLFLSIELFILGSFLLGLIDAIRNAAVKIYIAECAPSCYRGFFTQFSTSLLLIIFICGQTLMQPTIFGNELYWHYIVIIVFFLILFSYILGLFLPESPKYLYFKNKDKDKIVSSIRTYQGKNVDICNVFTSYDKEMKLTQNSKLSIKEVWNDPILKKSLILITMVGFAGSANLGMILESYENIILISFGMTQESVLYFTSIITIFNLPLALMGPILLEKLGRRTLIITASFVYIFLPLVAFVAQILSEAHGPNQLTVIMGIVIVFIHYLTSGICHYGTIALILVVDLMPTGAKTVVTQIVLLIMYFGVFVPTFLYPNFQNFLGSLAFLPFSFISFGFFVYFYFNLVETKQKEVYENVNQMEFEAQQERFLTSKENYVVKRKRATTLMPLLEDTDGTRKKLYKYSSINFEI